MTMTFKRKLFESNLFQHHYQVHNLAAYLDKDENCIMHFKNIEDAFTNKYEPFHKAKIVEEPATVLNG